MTVLEAIATEEATGSYGAPYSRAFKTHTGVMFDLFDLSTWEFRREDIARSLSNLPRFAGHIDPRSVAQHSLHVRDILDEWGWGPDVQLLGLLHDATEAYMLDIPNPWKGSVSLDGVPYRDREEEMGFAIFSWAGKHVENALWHWDVVKEADWASFEVERNARRSGTPLPYEHPNTVMNTFLMAWEYLDQQCGVS